MAEWKTKHSTHPSRPASELTACVSAKPFQPSDKSHVDDASYFGVLMLTSLQITHDNHTCRFRENTF